MSDVKVTIPDGSEADFYEMVSKFTTSWKQEHCLEYPARLTFGEIQDIYYQFSERGKKITLALINHAVGKDATKEELIKLTDIDFNKFNGTLSGMSKIMKSRHSVDQFWRWQKQNSTFYVPTEVGEKWRKALANYLNQGELPLD